MDNLLNLKDIPYVETVLRQTSESTIQTVNGQSIYSALFSKQYEPFNDDCNEYEVFWDLTEFFKQSMQQLFEWGIPHSVKHITSSHDSEKALVQQELAATFAAISYVPAYYKVLTIGRHRLVIINQPLQGYNNSPDIVYGALGVDNNGNYFHLYWNIINLFSPFKIELTKNLSSWGKLNNSYNKEQEFLHN